jgi:hypothetical protein
MFPKLVMFPSSGAGRETPTLLSPLGGDRNCGYLSSPEDGNISSSPKRCVFWYLEFQTMDQVQKPSDSECYTPSAKPTNCHILSKCCDTCKPHYEVS